MPELAVRLLGTVQIVADGAPVAPHAGRVSTLLALLGMEAGRVVSLDRITQQLWGDDPPPSGRSTLYAYVSRLRAQLEPTPVRLVSRGPGYVLEAPPDSVDAHVFADLVAAADELASAGAWDAVLDHAGDALSLWRGVPFADTIAGDDLENESNRLQRLAERAHELSARALLALGRSDEAARRAQELIARDRLNETYWRLRMRAEHAGGRPAVALSTYDEFRRLMSDELGIDPSEPTRALHLEILRAADASSEDPVAVATSPAADSSAPPPIGRDKELAVVERAVAVGMSGHGRIVLVEGEAGIGKTRLAEHAADQARRAGALTVWARAADGPGTPPLWVWEQVLAELGHLSGTTGASPLTLTEPQADSDVEPEQARFRLHQRIVAELVSAADRAPLLLVLDDMQWADEGTLQTLRLLSTAVRDRACTVVVTARPRAGTRTDALASIARDATTDRLWLEPLTREDVGELLTRIPEAVPDDAEALWTRSGGNPLILLELMRHGPSADLPVTVAEMFDQRFAVLSDQGRRLLDIAAVAGRVVDPVLLARSAGVPVVDVVRRLQPLRDHGLVVNDPAVRSLVFAHDLVREAVLTRLPTHEATALHARIADAIEAVHADDLTDHLDELADHRFAAAAGAPSTVAYEACLAAADQATRRRAYDQAAVHRSRALSTLAPGPDHRVERFEVLLDLVTERQLSGDALGAVATLRQAVDLARLLGDPTLIRRAVAPLGEVTLWNWRHFDQLDDEIVEMLTAILAGEDGPPVPDDERASLLGALAVELYYSGDDQRCRDLADEAVRLARDVGDPALLGRTLNNFAIAAWFPAYRDERLARVDEALSLADRGLPQPTELIALLHRGPLHLERGEVLRFAERLSRAEWLAPRLGRPDLEAQVAFQRFGLTALRGEHAAAADDLDRTVAQYSRTSLWGSDWTALTVGTHLARLEGRLGDVTDRLIAKASEDGNRTLRWSAVLALAQLGDLRQARSLQQRWGLLSMPRRPHWGSSSEWAQAAEIGLLLGSPSPAEAYEILAPLDVPVLVVGTALAVIGPLDDLLGRLAAELGMEESAGQHRARALAVTATVEAELGVRPSWPLAVG